MAISRSRALTGGHRAALLVGCSLTALAAAAPTTAAAQQVTVGYRYGLSSILQAPVSATSPTSVDLLPSANDIAGNSVFGHDYGTVGGTFGTRSSGKGLYSISGFSDYQATFTNNTAAASDFTLTYVLENGQVNIGNAGTSGRSYSARATAVLKATYSPTQTATLLNYAVSLNSNGFISAPPTFSETGLVLNPAGPTLSTTGGDYSWATFTGTVDLGVLAPGASAVIDYRLDSTATGFVPLGATTGLNALAAVIGYGGSSDGSLARFGDPFSGSGSPAPFVITASAVPEPASLAILGAGLAALALGRRRSSI